MTTATVGVICSIVFSALGFLVAYLTFRKKEKDSNILDGETKGSILSTLKYIKETADTLSRQLDNIRNDVVELQRDVAVLKEKTKTT